MPKNIKIPDSGIKKILEDATEFQNRHISGVYQGSIKHVSRAGDTIEEKTKFLEEFGEKEITGQKPIACNHSWRTVF